MSGNKLIPRQFTLGGKTYKVGRNDKLDYEHNWSGEHDAYRQEVNLAYKLGGVESNIESIEQSFYHELVHAILHSLGEKDLNSNEKFVDMFGTMLHQFMKTKK